VMGSDSIQQMLNPPTNHQDIAVSGWEIHQRYLQLGDDLVV